MSWPARFVWIDSGTLRGESLEQTLRAALKS